MIRPRRNASWRLATRRICVCVALPGSLAAAIGFPLPHLSSKDHRQPFPCQDHPCGCQTAEQCWRHCCCFSPEERLAWAEAHHVEPPAYAERPAARGWQTVRLRDELAAREGSTHCAQCATPPTCLTCDAPASRSCCSKDSTRSEASRHSERPARTPWMLGVAELRCQGGATLWVSAGAAVPPPALLMWTDSLLASDWLSPWNASALPRPLIPPDPPPRSFCV